MAITMPSYPAPHSHPATTSSPVELPGQATTTLLMLPTLPSPPALLALLALPALASLPSLPPLPSLTAGRAADGRS